ncbi:hypothetical protein LNA01_26010 [Companilactobacillus nantensis]|nr:hypothetical protein LNA01_26010 [Companilactobacillus nantensis]
MPEVTSVAKIANVVNNGVFGNMSKDINYYNLDTIIFVGYRVNSIQATHFRQWATKVLNNLELFFSPISKRLKKEADQLNDQLLFNRINYLAFLIFLMLTTILLFNSVLLELSLGSFLTISIKAECS